MKTMHSVRKAILLLFFVVPFFAFAQTEASALLAYADDETAVELLDTQGVSRRAAIGDTILSGETIRTKNTSAELRLQPNGSIIKLSRNTTFKIEQFADQNAEANKPGTNIFSVVVGKIRAIAAKTSGRERYQVRTPTAVCAIRGTDFALAVEPGKRDALFVKRGLVEFSRLLPGNAFQTILVGGGQFADTFAQSFAARTFTEQQLRAEYQDMEFSRLDANQVVQGEGAEGSEASPPAEQTPAEQTPPEQTPSGDTPSSSAPPPSVESTQPVVTDATQPAATEESEEQRKVSELEKKIYAWLGDVLGFQIGSLSINGVTYGKAIIQPVFQMGKLKMGLYMPVIYTSNLFDPNDWYKPAGNNEWSFGTEYWGTDNLTATLDLVTDIVLKIRFVEYGDRYVDPFYLNIGNLNSMTIGHGAIMNNFANDADFPAIRRIGLNTGYDFGKFGFEVVVNDLADPEIFGARFKFLKFFGVSAIADIDPAGDLAQADQDAIGDPILIGTGLDLDFPIIKLDIFHLRAFADVAAVLPYTRTAIVDGPDAGLQFQSVWNTSGGVSLDSLQNYGVMAGFLGRVLFIDWRLEYRNYRGAFKPSFFDATYERNRAAYARQFADMLTTTPDGNYTTMNGIYGEAGFNLLKEKLIVKAGYMMPWSWSGTVDWATVMNDDYIKATLVIKKGLIPVVDVAGSITYERTGLVGSIMDGSFSLFDSRTILSGEIIIPVTTGMDIAAIVGTSARRDAEGNIVYSGDTVVMDASLTIETRISF